jgi:putative tricarboxylic transport membrane protein
MRMRIANQHDFFAGLLFVGIGAAFLGFGASLRFGTAAQMGPGFLPRVIALALIAIGAVVALRSLRGAPAAVEGWGWRPLALVVGATLLFAVSLERLGLALAVLIAVGVGGMASRSARPLHLALLGVALAAFCVILFIYGFRMPLLALPVWGDR